MRLELQESRERKAVYKTRPISKRDVEDLFSLVVDVTTILDSNSRRLNFDKKIKGFVHDASEYLMKAWVGYSDSMESNGSLAMAESDEFLDIEI